MLGLGAIAVAVAPVLHPQAVDEAVLVAAMSSGASASAGTGAEGDATATSDASTPDATDPTLVDPEAGSLAPVDPAADPTAAAGDPVTDESVSGATRGSERVEIAPTPDAATVAAQFATELVDATNAERSTAGLAALAVSECATGQALARAGVLVAEDRFEHDPLDPVIEACGGSGVGENLALGYATPAAMMAGWMASEGHRLNILRAYTSVGIGCVKGSKGMLCAQVFLS